MIRLTPFEVSLIARIAQGEEEEDALRDVRDKYVSEAKAKATPRLIRNEEYVTTLTDAIIHVRRLKRKLAESPDDRQFRDEMRNAPEGAKRIVEWAYTNRRADTD